MTEEEYFRKNYPDSCYGDKPLSPHWDFFQDGVEFGERQSEKKIEELKAQLEREKNLNQCMSDHNEQLRELIEKIKQCGNCGNRTIGNCEYCKRKPNQILADTLTSDYWKLKEIKENA